MKRRLLSTGLALTLAMSSTIAAFAAPEIATPSTASPSDATIEGEGKTEYIDLELYSVVVPTDETLNFTLDPQGLLDIEDGESATLDELGEGKIIPQSKAVAINNSAIDLKLSVEFTGTTTGGNFVTTEAAVEGDTNNNVLLYALPSQNDFITGDEEYAASSKGYVITEAPSTLEFVLGAAEYKVTNTGGVYNADVTPGTGHGTAIQLGGKVNSEADWKTFIGAGTDKVGVEAVFKFAKAEEADKNATKITDSGLLENGNTTVDVTVPVGFANGATSAPLNTTVAAVAADDVTVSFNFGDGDIDKSSVAWDGTPLTVTLVNSAYVFDKANGKIGVKKGIFTTATSADITFKLTGDSTTYTLELAVTN